MRTDVLEYIACSAIWFDDGKEYVHQPFNIKSGYVIAGLRHHNCFATLSILTNKNQSHLQYEKVQGFLTSKGRFVNRQEGLVVARSANQVSADFIAHKHNAELHSEDIY